MKRILPALLVALAAFACACQPTPPTTNTNANANTNTTVNTNNGNKNGNVNTTDLEILRNNHEQRVQIYLTKPTPTSVKCDIEVDREMVSLDGSKDKIRWVAYNDCDLAENARLIIESFGKNNSGPNGHSPFGDDPYDNRFVFDPIANGEEGRLISKIGKKPGKYRYTLKLFGARDADLGMKDPEVEVGGLVLRR